MASSSKQFVLVRWTEDEMVGVMPISAVMKDYTPQVGAVVKMKWRGKQVYEAEILKISEDRQKLNKLCDSLVKMDITIEDILNEERDRVECVDSTTRGLPDTTTTSVMPETPPLAKKTKIEKPAKTKGDATLKQKAKHGPVSEKRKSALAKVAAAKQRANNMFSSFPTSSKGQNTDITLDISSSDDDDDDANNSVQKTKSLPLTLLDQLKTQQSLIESLQQQLESIKRNTTLFSAGSQADSRENSKIQSRKLSEVIDPGNTSLADHELDNTDNAYKTSTPIKEVTDHSTKYSAEEKMHKSKAIKTNPLLIEVVKGYGVKCTQRQLDEVEANSGSPTKMIRLFMDTFFTEEELGRSSCYGNRNNERLDGDIIAACIKYVQGKYKEVGKSVLVEAINDKCAQVRRKLRRKHY